MPDAATPDPAWTPYYTFAAEGPLADGIRVIVSSGDATSAPAPAPGTVHRFVAADPSEALLHFPAAGVELRLAAPDGKVAHQGVFLPDAAFTAVAARIIRKADGTAFFLLLDDAGGIPPNTVRLAFTLARKADATLSILRQSGSEEPEMVVLDFTASGG